jgi:hypothetical protein
VNNLTDLEFPRLDVLQRLLLRDDNLVTINAELLDDMGKNTFEHVTIVFSNNLVHGFGDFTVGTKTFDHTFTSAESSVGGCNNFSLASIGLVITNNDSVRGVCRKTIDVSTTDNFTNIT